MRGGNYTAGNVFVGILSPNWGRGGENTGFLAYSYFLFIYRIVKISHKCRQLKLTLSAFSFVHCGAERVC